MKIKLTLLSLVIAFLSSCYHTTIKEEKKYSEYSLENYCRHDQKKTTYTNTSSSKYLEVTIKVEYRDGEQYTTIIKLKPGEIKRDCVNETAIVKIVGEREITGND
jgi:hypothetical protein